MQLDAIKNIACIVNFTTPNAIGDVVVSGEGFKERMFSFYTFISFKILFFQLITAG